MAFPGADLVRSARAEPPPPLTERAVSKGPAARFSTRPVSTPQETESSSEPNETASEDRKPAPTKPVRDPRKSREFEGCLETYPEKACRQALDAAVERYARTRVRQADVVATRAPLKPLAFDEDPLWVRRLEWLGTNGVALKRVRTGGGHEWVFGISPEGVVGFSFEERAGD